MNQAPLMDRPRLDLPVDHDHCTRIPTYVSSVEYFAKVSEVFGGALPDHYD